MEEALRQFALKGDITAISPLGNGLINKTFRVDTTEASYVFQYVNVTVFPNVEGLMSNIDLVTKHLEKKGIPTLSVIPTKDGKSFLCHEGEYLRGYEFIEDAFCYEKLPSLDLVEACAKGFGIFHRGLADLDATKLVDVIPGFHDTPKRWQAFQDALRKNAASRAHECMEEICFLQSQTDVYPLLMDGLKRGEVRYCVAHNDPKINNVAFSKKDGSVRCVLDLDTVMGGTFLFDFGDGLRSLFTGDNEDNRDTSLMKVDVDVYRAYLRGYMEQMRDVVTREEVALMPYSVLVITLELAMRFLMDFLNGDVYFRVSCPDHNLVRARTQIALAKDILLHLPELASITEQEMQAK
ncbi:MAG: phosphotransferase [Bacilli bacterium]|nr:phosphotransferase [Bacilli bacterium]